MKFFLGLTASVVIFLATVVGGITLKYQQDHPAPAGLRVAVDERFMPGNPLPAGFECYFNTGSLIYVTCIAQDISRAEIDVQYDRTLNSIQYAEYLDGKDTVLDLMTAWGQPNGYDCDASGGYTFYWNDREAYMHSKYGLSLWTKIEFLSFGTPRHDYADWPTYKRVPDICEAYK